MSTTDITVFLIYLAAVVAFGCWFLRKSRTAAGFMVAGGALPGWAVGLSIFGTFLSSNTFLGVPGKAYGSNWNAFVFSLTLPLVAWVAVKYFVPFYRGGGGISAYQHLEDRFGYWARAYALVCYLLNQFARVGAVLFGVAIGLTALTGWDTAAIILATGVLVTFYTLLGGIEAVVWTDVVQSIVLLLGALVVTAILLAGMPEGPGQAVSLAAAEGKFSLGSFRPDFTAATVWVVLLYGVFINLNNFGIDQSYVQRYHAAASDRAAARSVWFGALLYVPVSLLFFFIGSTLFSYYEAHPERLQEVRLEVAQERDEAGKLPPGTTLEEAAAALGPADVGDKVLPHFIAHELPPGLAGLILAALFAAAMSSIDTSLNSSATVLLEDVYRRRFRPGLDDRGALRFLRLTTVVCGVLGTGVALAMIGVKSLLDAWWLLSGVFSGGLLGLFLLGFVARHATRAAAATGVVSGVLVILWMTLSPRLSDCWSPLRSAFHANMVVVVGTLVIFTVGLLLSPRQRAAPPAR